jgi:hypothetical protein
MGIQRQSMRQLMERLEQDLIEAKKVPPLEPTPRQSAYLMLAPKDFTEQGWSALLYQLGMEKEKHFGVGAKTVQRIEIMTAKVMAAYNIGG